MKKNDKEIIKQYVNDNINFISENKSELYSIIIPLIISKKLLKKKEVLKEFIRETMGIEFAEYAYKSRTILLGKLLKFINELPIEESFVVYNQACDYIKKEILNNTENTENYHNKEEDDKTDFFGEWDKVINDSSEIECEVILSKDDEKVIEIIVKRIIDYKDEILDATRKWQEFSVRKHSDAAYRMNRENISNYFDKFSQTEIMVIQSIMYIGRDVYGGIKFFEKQGRVELFKSYFKELKFNINSPIDKDIEINQMVGKSRLIAEYFQCGFKYINKLK